MNGLSRAKAAVPILVEPNVSISVAIGKGKFPVFNFFEANVLEANLQNGNKSLEQRHH
jgi:hypothetical protein